MDGFILMFSLHIVIEALEKRARKEEIDSLQNYNLEGLFEFLSVIPPFCVGEHVVNKWGISGVECFSYYMNAGYRGTLEEVKADVEKHINTLTKVFKKEENDQEISSLITFSRNLLQFENKRILEKIKNWL